MENARLQGVITTSKLSDFEQAIHQGNHKAVESIVEEICNADQHAEDHLQSPLLRWAPAHIERLHNLAKDAANCKKHTAQTLNNSGVYKRFAIATASLLIGGYSIGSYIWQQYQSGQWDSSDFFGTLAAGGALGLHSLDHFCKGFANHDAHQEYAKQIAIMHLTDKAKRQLVPEPKSKP